MDRRRTSSSAGGNEEKVAPMAIALASLLGTALSRANPEFPHNGRNDGEPDSHKARGSRNQMNEPMGFMNFLSLSISLAAHGVVKMGR